MHTLYGIWIDHSHAYIIKSNVVGDNMSIHEVSSGVESHHKTGISDGEHHTIVNQKNHEERRHNQMHAFAEEIISQIQDADEILVFGPSNAKHEFKHVLEQHKALHEKLKSVETSDKMTEPEMKAFVKKHFMLPR